jgi:hypothetical protein
MSYIVILMSFQTIYSTNYAMASLATKRSNPMAMHRKILGRLSCNHFPFKPTLKLHLCEISFFFIPLKFYHYFPSEKYFFIGNN